MQGDEEGVEEQRSGAPAKIRTPTRIELEDHFNSGHARYRSWCPYCAAAKGQGTPHRTRDDNPSEVAEVAFDYFYFGDKFGPGLPCIAGKDRSTGSFAGTMLESKGRNNYATAYVAGWIKGLGYSKIVARSDNEPSILALLSDVRASLPEVTWIPKASTEGDHQQNGLAEVGVREVEGQSRVILLHTEANYRRSLKPTEPLYAWIPRFAANAINRNRIGLDGRTPEKRRVGKKWQKPTVWFGEQCLFMPAIGATKERPKGSEARLITKKERALDTTSGQEPWCCSHQKE